MICAKQRICKVTSNCWYFIPIKSWFYGLYTWSQVELDQMIENPTHCSSIFSQRCMEMSDKFPKQPYLCAGVADFTQWFLHFTNFLAQRWKPCSVVDRNRAHQREVDWSLKKRELIYSSSLSVRPLTVARVRLFFP